MLRAKATYLDNNRLKVSPSNVLANLYDDYKPPKQELGVSGDLIHTYDVKVGSALSQLLAAAGFAPVAGASDKRASQTQTPPVD
jgi:hypothetical protein